ncbi:TauD/TfdA family dioxygenase (plasmid) [Agrobacterium sp. rho-8.1]|nr:TauD/TfdA family dioxygenase [Agrobacterium sp. rho-8.1]
MFTYHTVEFLPPESNLPYIDQQILPSEIQTHLRTKGVLRVKHSALSERTDEELVTEVTEAFNTFGSLVPQNNQGDTIVIVQNHGEKMESGGRYHRSNQGGSIHTDGPMIIAAPDLISLFCLHQGADGGDSILVDIGAMITKMRSVNPEALAVLERPVWFDCKNYYGGRPAAINVPALEFTDSITLVRARFLRDYILSGYEIAGIQLPSEVKEAVNFFDSALSDLSFSTRLRLEKGEGLLINNRLVAHGRTAFLDGSGVTRKMVRLWYQTSWL